MHCNRAMSACGNYGHTRKSMPCDAWEVAHSRKNAAETVKTKPMSRISTQPDV